MFPQTIDYTIFTDYSFHNLFEINLFNSSLILLIQFVLVQLFFHSVSLDISIFTPKNIQRARSKKEKLNEMKNTQERNNITISSRRSTQLGLQLQLYCY